MALMQLTMIPLGSGISVGDFVAHIQHSLKQSNATFRLNDMGTLIEGEITELFAILKKIYEIPFDQGAVRVVTHITIDDRRDKDIKIGDKTASVTARLNELSDEKKE